jgi:hypothetical protein
MALQSQFEKIGPHGTNVVLFNLRMAELDFTTGKYYYSSPFEKNSLHRVISITRGVFCIE